MMQIRPGQARDAAVIVRFQLAMAEETEGEKLDPQRVADGVRTVFERPHCGRYFVAEDEGKLVACLLVQDEWSDWRNATVWWIHSVYVDLSYRGRGVYRALYAFLQAEAQKQSVAGLRLYVDKRNRAAQDTYARLGMTKEHYDLYEWLPS